MYAFIIINRNSNDVYSFVYSIKLFRSVVFRVQKLIFEQFKANLELMNFLKI